MTNKFDKVYHSFGKVKSKGRYTTYFNYLGESKISKITSSCGCTVTTLTDDQLRVIFVPEKVPQHLRYKNSYKVTKKIIVTLENEDVIILKINAEIYD